MAYCCYAEDTQLHLPMNCNEINTLCYDWIISSHHIHALLYNMPCVLILEMASEVIEPFEPESDSKAEEIETTRYVLILLATLKQ